MRERMKENNGDPTKVWESIWHDGISPWDLGGLTKALISEIQYKSSQPTVTLVSGCGSGFYLLSLGRHLDSKIHAEQAYTIIGLELSATSLHRPRRIVKESNDNDVPFQHTTILLFEGDFFQNPSLWSPFFSTNDNSHKSLIPKRPWDQQSSFIFDYTFFCAISSRQWKWWGQQMQELLAPDGNLLTLMFPFHPSAQKEAAEAQTQGPPYRLSWWYKLVLCSLPVSRCRRMGLGGCEQFVLGPDGHSFYLWDRSTVVTRLSVVIAVVTFYGRQE